MQKIIAFLLIFSTLAQADEVKYIRKGEPAPFTGYIFDLEAEQKNQAHLLRKDQLELQVSLFKQNEEDLIKNSLMWKTAATEATESLAKVNNYSFWQNAGFFALGVVVTGALAVGLSKGINQ